MSQQAAFIYGSASCSCPDFLQGWTVTYEQNKTLSSPEFLLVMAFVPGKEMKLEHKMSMLQRTQHH